MAAAVDGKREEGGMTTSIVLALGALLLLAGVLYVAVSRPLIHQLVARPGYVWTNAITIQAPAARVWPWLEQLGQGRGGLYSYDWLENLLGCDVHSSDRILPQFQAPLKVGDRVVRMARYAPGAPVALFEPERALVLGNIKDTDAELAAGQARSTWRSSSSPSTSTPPGCWSAAAATR
jgi:hypothetical protein